MDGSGFLQRNSGLINQLSRAWMKHWLPPVANEIMNGFAAMTCCLGAQLSEAVNMGPAFTTEANWNDHGRHSERGQGCPKMLTR